LKGGQGGAEVVVVDGVALVRAVTAACGDLNKEIRR
jgi:hypothetical protein